MIQLRVRAVILAATAVLTIDVSAQTNAQEPAMQSQGTYTPGSGFKSRRHTSRRPEFHSNVEVNF